jgi:hypothetical protein
VGLYVYAVLEGDPPPLPGARMRFVSCGGLSVAVRSAPGPPAPRRPALRRHAEVVHRLWDAAPAVLPARFGSLVADEPALLRELQPRLPELRAALRRVRGRAQMTLRVWNPVAGRRGPATSHPDAVPGTGRQYLAARAAFWRGADVPGLPALLEALRPLRAAEHIERHAQAPLAASVYHLVDRARVGEYRRALARGRGRLRLRVSGPWPPYAFAPGVGA